MAISWYQSSLIIVSYFSYATAKISEFRAANNFTDFAPEVEDEEIQSEPEDQVSISLNFVYNNLNKSYTAFNWMQLLVE